MTPQVQICGKIVQDRPIIYVVMLALYFVFSLTPVDEFVDMKTYDSVATRFVPHADAERPLLVAIDDDSLAMAGRWPWSRRHLADILHSLSASGAGSVALDILLPESGDDLDDAMLIAAASQQDHLLLAIAPHPYSADRMLQPWPELRRAASGLAHSEIEYDNDNVVRRIAGFREFGGSNWPGLAFALSKREALSASYLAPYPLGEPFDRLSAIDLLSGAFDQELVQGRLVLVGVTAGGTGPRFTISDQRRVSGVELQAYHLAAVANDILWTESDLPTRAAIWGISFALVAYCLSSVAYTLLALPLFAILALLVGRTALLNFGIWLAPGTAILAVAVSIGIWLLCRWRSSQQRALRDRALAATTLAAVADAVIATDDSDRITVVNRAAEKLIGLDRDAAIGRSIAELEPLQSIQRTSSEPTEIIDFGGRAHRILVSIGKIEPGGGSAYVLHDVSERERAGAALAASERERLSAERRLESSRRMSAVAEVSAAIAHELNQPLAALTTYAATEKKTMSGQEGDSPGPLAELIDKIANQANRSANVVKKLRKVFEQSRPTELATDLGATLRESLDLAEREYGLNSGRVRLFVANDLPNVAHDRIQIQQLILNLIRNSVEAHSHTHQLVITVTAESDDHDTIRIAVADNGPGVDRAVADDLFEPLASGKDSGLGIGLAISRSIAEAHGGALSYDPPASGGARFVLSIPQK